MHQAQFAISQQDDSAIDAPVGNSTSIPLSASLSPTANQEIQKSCSMQSSIRDDAEGDIAPGHSIVMGIKKWRGETRAVPLRAAKATRR